MIQKLSIRNFKSIRELDLDCRRVNVFIGEPNAGKTNILEALFFWCPEVRESGFLKSMLRASQAVDLFRDQQLEAGIEIGVDDEYLRFSSNSQTLTGKISRGDDSKGLVRFRTSLAFDGGNSLDYKTSVYSFDGPKQQNHPSTARLEPPYGYNLANLLYVSKEARQSSARFFIGSGYRLNVDYTARRLLITKEVDETFVSFPYGASSETLRRMVFFTLALDTNRDQILVFDEPEAHSFPPYTKTLAERIALDDRGNQFFLTTHSPYMLDSLLSKTPAKDLNVVLCRMENFETKAYSLNQEQIDQIKEWSMDAFFNFDRLLPEVG